MVRQTLLAMITTGVRSSWPGDTPITDLGAAGLKRPCVVRLKLVTVVNRLIAARIGYLTEVDRRAVATALSG